MHYNRVQLKRSLHFFTDDLLHLFTNAFYDYGELFLWFVNLVKMYSYFYFNRPSYVLNFKTRTWFKHLVIIYLWTAIAKQKAVLKHTIIFAVCDIPYKIYSVAQQTSKQLQTCILGWAKESTLSFHSTMQKDCGQSGFRFDHILSII